MKNCFLSKEKIGQKLPIVTILLRKMTLEAMSVSETKYSSREDIGFQFGSEQPLLMIILFG